MRRWTIGFERLLVRTDITEYSISFLSVFFVKTLVFFVLKIKT
ncbi:hypothetical protein BH18ACI3_BH18ACI3_02270 [soil metagenome]